MKLVTNSGKIIWVNDLPNSPDITRWLKASCTKETYETTISNFQILTKQIETFSKHVYYIETINGNKYKLSGQKSVICTTMYDGKSLNALSKHLLNKDKLSHKDCFACSQKQTEFANDSEPNNIPNKILNLGIAPLHILLRSMEFVFNLAITVQVGKASQKSEAFMLKKQEFKRKFKSDMHLRLFEVHKDYGNSNVGNSCRRFFQEAEKTSEILQLPIEILEAFHCLNTIISTTHKKESSLPKFLEIKSFLMFMLTKVEPFNSKLIIPTVHRALCHYETYFRHFEQLKLPFGALSESALEARNKYTHRFRELLAFKGNMRKNLRDLGVRSLLSFDPLISLKIRNFYPNSNE